MALRRAGFVVPPPAGLEGPACARRLLLGLDAPAVTALALVATGELNPPVYDVSCT